jgi:hypothetical protein
VLSRLSCLANGVAIQRMSDVTDLVVAEILDHVCHDQLHQPELHSVRAAYEDLSNAVHRFRLGHHNRLLHRLVVWKTGDAFAAAAGHIRHHQGGEGIATEERHCQASL